MVAVVVLEPDSATVLNISAVRFAVAVTDPDNFAMRVIAPLVELVTDIDPDRSRSAANDIDPDKVVAVLIDPSRLRV